MFPVQLNRFTCRIVTYAEELVSVCIWYSRAMDSYSPVWLYYVHVCSVVVVCEPCTVPCNPVYWAIIMNVI